jgi:hypothetical protein
MLMRRLVWIVVADSLVLMMLVLLVQHNVIKMYPAALLTVGALCALNFWPLKKMFQGPTIDPDRERLELFARRGTTRMLWAYSIAIVVAIILSVVERDPRYLVQAGFGVFLVGYVVYALRRFNRTRKDGKL